MGAFVRGISAVVAASLVAAGCGTSDREADLVAVSDSFHAALEERDGGSACAQLSEDAAEKLEFEEKTPCRDAVLELDLPAGARASSAEVYVTSGYAELPGSDVAFLDHGPDGWKVTAAGCSPSSPDHPYKCELGG